MRATNVHLEDVAKAARWSRALSLAVSLLALAVMVLAGTSPLLASAAATAGLVIGGASGGFGLTARIALRRPRPRRAAVVRTGAGLPVRMPQPR
jgi:hypothetical protein